MHILISGPIDEEVLSKLIEAYNKLEEEGTGQLHIMFESAGGQTDVGEAIIELINRYKDVTTITFYGMVASMGFQIAACVRCVRKVLDTAYAICHLSRWQTQILEGGKALDDFSRFKEKKMKRILASSVEFYEGLGFKEDEITEMKTGKDVFIDAPRLQKMLKNPK